MENRLFVMTSQAEEARRQLLSLLQTLGSLMKDAQGRL